eukprot:TRINITY_DN6569_c0_g1_i1.p3 TRINITY_DN6569_c0_g1~~TRINITY_DN6569_c0_g1_i1.p3  ORF type:complete len:125 (-),score=35.55 TRINITY_DN6569_c0_g1_i1:90-464(-)
MASVSRVQIQATAVAQPVVEQELSQQAEPSPLVLDAADLAGVDATIQSLQSQLDHMVKCLGLQMPTDSLVRIRQMLFDYAVTDAYKQRYYAAAPMAIEVLLDTTIACPPVLPPVAAYAHNGERE